MRGELRKFVDNVREELLVAIAHSEVMIDYAEEDIPNDIIPALEKKLLSLEQKLFIYTRELN